MIDSYIILNRKPSLIIKIFIFNISIILVLLIWGINTLKYQNFFTFHSKIIYLNSYYVIEVLIPEKEVNQIINNNILLINDKKYNYSVYKIEKEITYKENTNYQKMYLKINNLEEKYLINNYRIDIKIPKNNKKIIEYIKE